MNAQRRRYALLYASGGAIVLSALGVLTTLVVRQQAMHARAVAEALHHEDLRTALWRMEARASAMLSLTTSTLASSTWAPGSYGANWIDPEFNAVNPEALPDNAVRERLVAAADEAFMIACTTPLESAESTEGSPPQTQQLAWTNPAQTDITNRGVQRSADEYARRQDANLSQQVMSNVALPSVERELLVGPLAATWDRSTDRLSLQLARRLQTEDGAGYVSYRLDWQELSRILLAEIGDLFPTAELVPIEDEEAPREDAERAQRLAAVPARLVVPPPQPAEGLPLGHLWILAGAWCALLFALGVGGLALRSSYAYGDKHRRFTHAVTHELRTPLTTFRMYSEMLARGMVPPGAQDEYLATLEGEATRLTRLVDNVLRYARLEDGGAPPRRSELCTAELLDRCVPELARTCAAAGVSLEVQDATSGRTQLMTDADAVLQILSNLVENACKYGRPPEDELAEPPRTTIPVVLRAGEADGALTLEVCDQGPGIPPAARHSIFAPFDRGGRDSSDRAPGVGLGLALARALAIELGGTLELLPAARGAAFRLTLPLLRG